MNQRNPTSTAERSTGDRSGKKSLSKSIRQVGKKLCLALPVLILALVIMEVVNRTVIPACESPHVLFDRDYRVMKYDRRARETGLFTIGPLARQRGRWRINNHGWNSEVDFVPASDERAKTIAIIGDSYVEGLQVDVSDGFVSVLRRSIGEPYRVYGFGMSGAPLSQYLQMSRYVRDLFDPDVLVFLVVHNDFRESIRELSRKRHFLQVAGSPAGIVEAAPEAYEPSTFRRLIGKSAIVRYMALNLNLVGTLSNVFRPRRTSEFRANIDSGQALSDRPRIEEATRYLVSQIRKENPRSRIIFVIDALRQDIYEGEVASPRLFWLHDLLRSAVSTNNCDFIDLTEPFREIYAADGREFNSRYDFHWNAVGHRAAADALLQSLRDAHVADP